MNYAADHVGHAQPDSSGQQILHTGSRKSEIPLEKATDNPLDISRENPLDKWQSFGNYHWKWNYVGKCHWKSIGNCHWKSIGKCHWNPQLFLRCWFLVCNLLPLAWLWSDERGAYFWDSAKFQKLVMGIFRGPLVRGSLILGLYVHIRPYLYQHLYICIYIYIYIYIYILGTLGVGPTETLQGSSLRNLSDSVLPKQRTLRARLRADIRSSWDMTISLSTVFSTIQCKFSGFKVNSRILRQITNLHENPEHLYWIV